MKIKIFVVLAVVIINSACEYIEFTRHIETSMNEKINFTSSHIINANYYFSTVDVVNYLNENIDALDANITNLQINNVKLSVELGKQNTANVLNNVEVVLLEAFTNNNIILFNVNSIPINSLAVIIVNDKLNKKGVQELRKFLENNIVGRKSEVFNLRINANVPSGQKFTGNISIIMDVTMDVVTCEEVFWGFEGEKCK